MHAALLAGAENLVSVALVERVIQYIDLHLDEPTLTPKRLAAVHGISLRYLPLLFAHRGQTVSGRIRERRLEYCCQVSAKPPLNGSKALNARTSSLKP